MVLILCIQVYEQVKQLFRGAPDLLAEFMQFLPGNSGTGNQLPVASQSGLLGVPSTSSSPSDQPNNILCQNQKSNAGSSEHGHSHRHSHGHSHNHDHSHAKDCNISVVDGPKVVPSRDSVVKPVETAIEIPKPNERTRLTVASSAPVCTSLSLHRLNSSSSLALFGSADSGLLT
ncbi:hypothetical protein BY996DRAFT_8511775 [Phakopsora pachyrhizi]|nr:hypothetical protein BY996DRAFT_8511775 [Phakopsora pachyrhizi]